MLQPAAKCSRLTVVSRLTDIVSGLFRRDSLGAGQVQMIGFGTAGGLIPYGVTGTTAVGLSAVWRCLDIIANSVSQLPWTEERGNLELPPSRIVRQPQSTRTRREWTQLVCRTAALYDTAYTVHAGGIDSEGVPGSLVFLNPSTVNPIYSTSDPYGIFPPEYYYVGQLKFSADDMTIFRRGPMPDVTQSAGGIINLARVTFAAALAAEAYASRYWQAGGAPVTQIKTDARLTQADADTIGDRWAQKRALGPDHPIVMGLGAEAKEYGADPTQQSAVEARRELVADISRYFGIPTRLVNAPTGDSETYTTTTDSNIDLLRFTVQNYIDMIGDGVSSLLPGGCHVTMDTTVLTQGSQLARAQAWQLATGNQSWMTPAEVREREKLPPIEAASLVAPQIGVPQ